MQSRAIQAIAVTLTLLLSGYLIFINREFFHDDAYISLRYAKHLLEGYGLVWNPGETIQGYSNFLHVMLAALLGGLGLDLIVAVRVIGFTAMLGIVLVLFLAARRDQQIPAELKILPALFALAASPFIVWALGGLETVLVAFLITVACLLTAESLHRKIPDGAAILTGSLFACAVLTRPDAIVPAGISLMFMSFTGWRSGSFRSPAVIAATIIIIIAPYLLWAQSYYGDFLPNTFYVKATGFSTDRLIYGLDYISDFFFQPPFLPLLAIVLGILCWQNGNWTLKHSYLAAIIFVHLLYVTWVGGDHMQAFRFIVPVIGLLGYLVVLCLSSLIANKRPAIYPALPVLAVLLLTMQIYSYKLNPMRMDRAAYVGRSIGIHINRAWPSGSLVAVNTAGSTPYYADKHTYIDMLGLNDRHIARRVINPGDIRLPWQSIPGHAKGDGRYVLDRRPDYIITGPAEGALAERPWFLSDLEIGEDPRLAEQYVLEQEIVTDSYGTSFEFIYYKKK